MHSVKLLALILAVILIISISTSQLPVEAQQNSKTELTLGIKKNIDGHPEGSEENAIPAIIHVEQKSMQTLRRVRFTRYQASPDI